MSRSSEVVRLYRHVLKLAKQYPSVKRDAIIEDIKLEFHEAKHLTDAKAIENKIAAARAGIVELSQYSSLRSNEMTWAVDIGREPQQQPPSATQADGNVKVVGSEQRKD